VRQRYPFGILVKTLFALAVTITSLYPARVAFANGRFPEAQQIALAPPGGDPKLIALRTTFGIIISHDAGKTWSWICEGALGFTGEWDPPIAITKDGRLWVGLPDGLRSTRDGCTSDEVADFHGDRVTDLAVDGSGENLVVLMSPLDRPAHVSILHANGKVDHVGGSFSGFQLVTVESAPSSGKLYVSGAPFGSGPRPHLFVAEKGKDLVETKIDLPPKANVFVSAVDPKNDARVVIRTLAPSGTDVLISNDSGKTFVGKLHIGTLLHGFARSEDGKTLFVGSGNPEDGVYRSDDRGETWTQINKVSVRCLASRGDSLFACSTPYRPNGFAIAVSTDRAQTFAPLNAFTDIGGPIACDGGAGAVCGDAWPAQRVILNPKPRDAGVDAAVDLSSMDGSTDRDGGAGRASHDRGCGCVAAGEENSTSPGRFLPLFLALILIARMDRRYSSLSPSRSI
jgi:hypothetical protein